MNVTWLPTVDVATPDRVPHTLGGALPTHPFSYSSPKSPFPPIAPQCSHLLLLKRGRCM